MIVSYKSHVVWTNSIEAGVLGLFLADDDAMYGMVSRIPGRFRSRVANALLGII